MKTMKIKSYLWVLALTAFSCSDETTAQNSIVPPVEPPVEEETFVISRQHSFHFIPMTS